MATLVFDILTAGKEWELLSPVTQQYLTKWQSQAEAGERLGLSPLTGLVVGLGLYDIERRESVVYMVSECESSGGYRAVSETELLTDFWDGVRSYNVFVTYGGRRFDVPFLLQRSLACGVRPSLLFPATRQLEKQVAPYHVDLHDQFTEYGAFRAPTSLHLLTEAFGIESPDVGVVRGEVVGEFFREKKFTDLAAYAEKTVAATAALYERWLVDVAPREFVNVIELQ